MRKRPRFAVAMALAVLAVTTVAGAAPAARQPAGIYDRLSTQTMRQFFEQHGYLPIHGVKDFYRGKEQAAAAAGLKADGHPTSAALAPSIGTTWQGISSTQFSPPDPNGAIGANSYVEIINSQIAVYSRTGALISTNTLNGLTGLGFSATLVDPMVLWDPDSQRFYFNSFDVNSATMSWGFSKSDNPTDTVSNTANADWCSYVTSFGYLPTNVPDYPKLGQTQDFIMIGVNFYESFSSQFSERSDLLWISKPQGPGPITNCPTADTFKSGKFQNLRNEDGSQAFTPVPAIQTDPRPTGAVLTSSDIECPGICGTGNLITVHTLRPSPADPTVPVLTVTGQSIVVPPFTSPPDAPQKNSANLLDTLDGRLTHAVSGLDPRLQKLGVWVAQTVAGGAGAVVRWYEVNADPSNPTLMQAGSVSDPSLYVYNGAVAPDRTVNPAGRTHGSSMVVGFTTSSANDFIAVQMVSKVGGGAQSAFVLVKQSIAPDNNFTCSPCRWGDYAGATSDPAAKHGAPKGRVWLTNQWTNGNDLTWNWEAIP